MLGFLKRLPIFKKLFTRQKPVSEGNIEEKWIADFGKPRLSRFNIKSEISYDANCRSSRFSSKTAMFLGIKKTHCIAWVDVPDISYRDVFLTASIRIDTKGYAAGGMLFRMVDSNTYYSLLISNKEYFRLDAVRNGMPFPLIAWTELPSYNGKGLEAQDLINFSIISYSNSIIILIGGQWAAEIQDSSIYEGGIGLCAASYDSGEVSNLSSADLESGSENPSTAEKYTAEIFLESLVADSHHNEVSRQYQIWHNSPSINPQCRLNLAGSFAAANQYEAALSELHKCWDMENHEKSQKELLLAGRLSFSLGLYREAEAYIGQCYEGDLESLEGREALIEMAKILDHGRRYKELMNFCRVALKISKKDPILWNFMGHAYWGMNDYTRAAKNYDKAFSLDKDRGIFAKNSANVYDVMGETKEALMRYLDAGRAFLKEGNNNDLGLIIPRLISLGEKNWEARSLAGKWAFAVEDWETAKKEFALAEKLRKNTKPRPKEDGAQVFLGALLLLQEGKRKEALTLLKKAISLEEDFALFHLRLAENLYLLNDDVNDPKMLESLNRALELSEKDEGESGVRGWANCMAAQIALRKGDLDAVKKHHDKAVEILGEDPEGILANCGGSILFHYGKYEEAEKKFREALAADPDNAEYLCNLANCHIKQEFFGEADELLTRANNISSSPAILEMISYVSLKKGEYNRAEQAVRAALESDPGHGPSLLSLGWILFNQGRFKEAEEILYRLENIEADNSKSGQSLMSGREELSAKLQDHLYENINCSLCSRIWKVTKDPSPSPPLRLYAMPPDDLPAGNCPSCGKTYCIGCAKKYIDSKGRFICKTCNQSLKLNHEGLKKLVGDWASKL